jgi:hypothetical protein
VAMPSVLASWRCRGTMRPRKVAICGCPASIASNCLAKQHQIQLRERLERKRTDFLIPTDALIIPLLRVSEKWAHRAPAGLKGVVFEPRRGGTAPTVPA